MIEMNGQRVVVTCDAARCPCLFVADARPHGFVFATGKDWALTWRGDFCGPHRGFGLDTPSIRG